MHDLISAITSIVQPNILPSSSSPLSSMSPEQPSHIKQRFARHGKPSPKEVAEDMTSTPVPNWTSLMADDPSARKRDVNNQDKSGEHLDYWVFDDSLFLQIKPDGLNTTYNSSAPFRAIATVLACNLFFKESHQEECKGQSFHNLYFIYGSESKKALCMRPSGKLYLEDYHDRLNHSQCIFAVGLQHSSFYLVSWKYPRDLKRCKNPQRKKSKKCSKKYYVGIDKNNATSVKTHKRGTANVSSIQFQRTAITKQGHANEPTPSKVFIAPSTPTPSIAVTRKSPHSTEAPFQIGRTTRKNNSNCNDYNLLRNCDDTSDSNPEFRIRHRGRKTRRRRRKLPRLTSK